MIYLLLALPTLIYIGYLVLRRRLEPVPPGGRAAWWRVVPWFWLAAAGLVLAIASLVFLALTEESIAAARAAMDMAQGREGWRSGNANPP